jgi:hypothetical protein
MKRKRKSNVKLVYEPQRSLECGVHSLNHIVAHTSQPAFMAARSRQPVAPMTTKLAKESARIAALSVDGLGGDDGSSLQTFEAVQVSVDVWNIINARMPRLRSTLSIGYDHAAESGSAVPFSVLIGKMLAMEPVLGAVVVGVTDEELEHFIAVVRVANGFAVVDSLAECDGDAQGKQKGLRGDIRTGEARFPFTADASEVHGLVLEALPGVTSSYYRPSYSLIFADHVGVRRVELDATDFRSGEASEVDLGLFELASWYTSPSTVVNKTVLTHELSKLGAAEGARAVGRDLAGLFDLVPEPVDRGVLSPLYLDITYPEAPTLERVVRHATQWGSL